MSKDERVSNHLGTDVLSATKRPSQTVLPATKKSTGEEPCEDGISHQSPQVLFSLGTTVLITQPSYEYNRCLLGPWSLGN